MYKQGTIFELIIDNLSCFDPTTYDRLEHLILRGEKVLLLEDKERHGFVKILLLKTNQVAKVYLWERYWNLANC